MAESGSSRSRWRDLAEASLDGVGVVDGETVAYANEAFAAAYGYDEPDGVVGETWRRLYPHDDRDRIEREVLPAARGDDTWRGAVTGLHADGSRVPQELSVREADDGALVVVVRDSGSRHRE